MAFDITPYIHETPEKVRDLRRVVTKVRIDNVASLALEISLGARESHRDDEYVYFDTFI